MTSLHYELEKKLQDPNATPVFLPLEFLKSITCDFSTESELGRGGYGVVYKGVLPSGKIIAVKKLFEIHLVDDKTFQKEVSCLKEIKHQHVVQLIGYCAESSWELKELPSGRSIWAEIPKRLLCFEYVSNKSLAKYISDESSGLEWNMRYEIIKGVCSGLNFLHEECRIVHLDLKPENIMMDAAMMPKIVDFGLARIFSNQESRDFTKNSVGSRGYMAPEYIDRGLISMKADIFSLGVIIIEIMTGRKDDYPYFQLLDSPESTATSCQHFTKKVLDMWRYKFQSTVKFISKMENYNQQIEQCITLALKCVNPIMEKRPTANDVIEVLNTVDQKSIPLSIKIISIENNNAINFRDIISIDANQTEPLIIIGHFSGHVLIWNYDTQKTMGPIQITNGAIACSVKFIARKGWCLVGSYDGVIHVYDYKKEMQKITSFKADRMIVESVAIHPTQPYVLSTRSKGIKLWDWDHGWKHMRSFKEHSRCVRAIAFNPEDYNSFASASNDGTIKIWSLDSPESMYTLCGHSDSVCSLDFFTRGCQQYLITGSADNTAKIWDMQTKECVRTLPHTSEVTFVLSHPELPLLVTGTWSGDVYFWSSTNFSRERILNIDGRLGQIWGLACLNESGRAVVAHREGASVIEICDEEEQGGSSSNNENSISAAD